MSKSRLTSPRHVEASVVTVGTYDGVHLGHRRLIAETMLAAQETGVKSVVVTFGTHPLAVLRPEIPLRLLCTQEEKVAMLESTGVDEVVVLNFDHDRAKESAEDFVTEELVGALGATQVVVGSNFRFGFQRHGDVQLLREMGKRLGFLTTGVTLVLDDEHHSVVSSTRIRTLISSGELQEAARLLGRTYTLTGTMQSPSEVALPDDLLLPEAGIYEVEISLAGWPVKERRVIGSGEVEIRESRQVFLHTDNPTPLSGLVTLGFPSDRATVAEANR
jgi:riboflavin kinase/FMN adenylyltransferase